MKLSVIFHNLLLFLTSRRVLGLRCFTCIDATSNEDCNNKGTIAQCASNELSCQNEVRLSERFKYRITKRCKQPLACQNNQAQNEKAAWDPTQCNPAFTQNSVCKCCCDTDLCNEEALPCDEKPRCPPLDEIISGKIVCNSLNFVGSVCRFECRRGFKLVGSRDTECIDRSDDPEWSHDVPFCERVTCSDEAPAVQTNGRVRCSDFNFASSVCTFACEVGYNLKGRSNVTCVGDGQWSDQFPTCERVQCTQLEIPNAISSCSDENFFDSQCLWGCAPGYRIEGEARLVCQDDSNWSELSPQCVREPCNPERSPPRNGSVKCTNGNSPLSTCTFSCGEETENGWELYGRSETSCTLNREVDRFEWSHDGTPCCARICPPFALVDLFLVLDSSSSVGIENWNRTLYFINDVLSQFEISVDNVLVAAIRYNRLVDTGSEIKIGEYPTKREIMNAIINLPYDGSGTHTGNALQYVVDEMLTNPSNRPHARDFVLVVTDGVSTDDVIDPARRLREAEATVLALGVLKEGGKLNKQDVVDITGSDETAFLVDSGFKGFSTRIIDFIEKKVCGKNPCI